MWPDLCWVPSNNTGLNQKDLWDVKLRQMGLITWSDHERARHVHPQDADITDTDVMLSRMAAQRPPGEDGDSAWKHITVFLGGSDAGPDVKGCRTRI
eukprot:6877831-Pyramimonas_sp.AAC.1